MSEKIYFTFGVITLIFCSYLIFMTELARKESNQLKNACEMVSQDREGKAQCTILKRMK